MDSHFGAVLAAAAESNLVTNPDFTILKDGKPYQPAPWPGSEHTSGCRSGIICTGSTKRQQHIVSRNNILHCRREKERAIHEPFGFESNDFDYDLIHGRITARDGSEQNGIRAIPDYEEPTGRPPGLRTGSRGHDAGYRIPNFNDGFHGAAPDMGAIETGAPFAVPATWPKFPALPRKDN